MHLLIHASLFMVESVVFYYNLVGGNSLPNCYIIKNIIYIYIYIYIILYIYII